MHTRLLWVDLETTGLNPHTDLMLELALVLTDGHLCIVDEASWVLGWTHIREMDISDFVREMHEGNGLFDAVERSTLCVREVEKKAIQWIEHHEARGLYMAGSGVHFDRGWLKVQMPTLATAFHYRNMDLTTLRYFFGTQKKDPGHRALADLRDNIRDLRGFAAKAREAGLVALPQVAAAG